MELYDSTMGFINSNTKKGWRKDNDRRVELPDYPERALEEGLVNALIHRSYNGLLILENNATASPMGEFLTRIKEQRDCDYHGVHEFFEFPLLNQDKEAHDLYMEVYFGKDGERFGCNFLQDKSLIRRYIRKCHQLGIKAVVLKKSHTSLVEEELS